MRPIARLAASVALAAASVAACGAPAPSGPAATTSGGSPTATPTPAPVATPAPAIVVDETLLGHLPASVDGIARRADLETAADIAADGALAGDVDGLAVALYVGPLPSADTALDYAVATVVRPRPGVVDDAWFRSWRETFDAGVCTQAGGVDPGTSEFELDGRTIHRSTCAGGVTIQHVHLPAADVIVSVQGSGERELGRAIVDDLTE